MGCIYIWLYVMNPTQLPVIAQLVERRTVVVTQTPDILRSLVRLRLAGVAKTFYLFSSSLLYPDPTWTILNCPWDLSGFRL